MAERGRSIYTQLQGEGFNRKANNLLKNIVDSELADQ
jgi:hypothetical protein